MKCIAAGVVGGAALFALVLGIAVIGAAGSAAPAVAGTNACVTVGAVPGLSAVAAGNARIVTAVAERRAGSAGAVIAVMVGYTESGLRLLGNPSAGTSGLPTQGAGGNLDSVGIFQQRSSWGTAAQRLDPELSTTMFMSRLLAVPGWRTEQPWVAAQKVQASAWDGMPRAENHFSSVYGGNYQLNLGLAQRVVRKIDVDASGLACGALHGGLPASRAPGSHGLPSSYIIPSSATAAEVKVVTFAISQLDKPYVFGAAGPSSFDCSGLTLAAWQQVGIALPHDASAQSREGTPTSPDALVPGDLVFVPGDDGTLAAPGHVGVYIGSGLVLNAADEQDGIRVQTYDNFLAVGHGLAALRHLR